MTAIRSAPARLHKVTPRKASQTSPTGEPSRPKAGPSCLRPAKGATQEAAFAGRLLKINASNAAIRCHAENFDEQAHAL